VTNEGVNGGAEVTEQPTPPTEPPTWDLVSVLREHTAIVFSTLVLMLTMLQLWRISHYDILTAFGLLQHVGTANVVLGLLFVAWPIAISFAFVGAFVIGVGDVRLTVVLTLLLVVFVPIIVVVPAVVAALVYYALYVRIRRREATESQSVPLPLRITFGVGIVIAGTLLLQLDIPWMPVEEIVVRGEDEPVVGYVLSSDSGSTVIMRDRDRQIIIFNRPWVERRICRAQESLHEWPYRTIPSLGWISEPSPKYPDCEE
jgi:hypothetical protein